VGDYNSMFQGAEAGPHAEPTPEQTRCVSLVSASIDHCIKGPTDGSSIQSGLTFEQCSVACIATFTASSNSCLASGPFLPVCVVACTAASLACANSCM